MYEQKIGYRVVEDIERPSSDLIERMRKYSTCEICDGMALYSAMNHDIKLMVGDKKKICGSAITIKLTLGDSLLVTKAISVAKPGDVIVIDGHGSSNNAVWGECRSLLGKKMGLEGVVVDGAIRDIEENKKNGFPVFAKSICCGASSKHSYGEINIPISCGGVAVYPGDIIIGDSNGICVVPMKFAEQIMKEADKKILKTKLLK
ncbi:MAG: RraA family protein, partial [Dysgonamonadaceae bacterium]|nr:RraA family protein [Dysgonamonadaceae bacterium]